MKKTTSYLVKAFGAWILATSLCLSVGAARAADPTGNVAGKVSVEGGKHNGNVVVYLEKVPVDTAPGKKREIWQREKQFDPQLAVIVKGTEIDFPNDDKIFHNVFSMSRAARFDLGLYKSGERKTVKFKRPGVVDVYCNIHPQMVAKILVVENKFYFQTGKDGKFEIKGVPAGTYKIVGWQAYGKPFEGEVTIKGKQTTKLDIKLKASSQAKASHTRKDGTPYGRYK